jgi:hypothetical protein
MTNILSYKLQPSWLGIINWSNGLPLSRQAFNIDNDKVIDYWNSWRSPSYDETKEYRKSFPLITSIDNDTQDIKNLINTKRLKKIYKRCKQMRKLFNSYNVDNIENKNIENMEKNLVNKNYKAKKYNDYKNNRQEVIKEDDILDDADETYEIYDDEDCYADVCADGYEDGFKNKYNDYELDY